MRPRFFPDWFSARVQPAQPPVPLPAPELGVPELLHLLLDVRAHRREPTELGVAEVRAGRPGRLARLAHARELRVAEGGHPAQALLLGEIGDAAHERDQPLDAQRAQHRGAREAHVQHRVLEGRDARARGARADGRPVRGVRGGERRTRTETRVLGRVGGGGPEIITAGEEGGGGAGFPRILERVTRLASIPHRPVARPRRVLARDVDDVLVAAGRGDEPPSSSRDASRSGDLRVVVAAERPPYSSRANPRAGESRPDDREPPGRRHRPLDDPRARQVRGGKHSEPIHPRKVRGEDLK